MPVPTPTPPRSRRLVVGAVAALTVLVTATGGLAMTAPVATVDAPASPVGEFHAAMCPGATDHDPRWSGPDYYTDLTLVSGERLEAYNAGQLVPLYDVDGTADVSSHPPLCAVRYDAATDGPVSEWSFCTDALLNTCNNLLPGGVLAEGDVPIPFPTLATPQRLNEQQLAAVDTMIRDGYTSPRGHVGRADGAVSERLVLQSMIWCVTDGINCDMFGLDNDEITRLANIVREWGDVTATNPTVRPGQEISWELRTTVFDSPITITSDVPVRVCEESAGHAELASDGTLVVRDAPTYPAEVRLCADAVADEGVVVLTARGGGDGTSYHQSDVTSTPLGEACQVYATWEPAPFQDSETVTVSSEPSEPSGPPTDEPAADAPGDGASTGSSTGTSTSGATEESTPSAASVPSSTDGPGASRKSDRLATTGTALGAAVGAAVLLVVGGTVVLLLRRGRPDAS
ncbi:hypothetical protein ACWFNS_05370 [Oerskovia enterophila]